MNIFSQVFLTAVIAALALIARSSFGEPPKLVDLSKEKATPKTPIEVKRFLSKSPVFPAKEQENIMKLKALALKLGQTAPLPPLGKGKIRYFTGHSYSMCRLLPQGHVDAGVDPSIRPHQGKWFSEHHYNASDQCFLIVDNDPKEARYVPLSFSTSLASRQAT